MPLGWQELAVILLIVVVLFGANKLPEIGSGLGKGIRGFKEESGLDSAGKPKNEAPNGSESGILAMLTGSDNDSNGQVAGDAGHEQREPAVRADDI